MRKFLIFIGCLLVLGAVLPGCHHVPHYDSRLTAADSLMRDNPDSVVAVLEALTTDSLTSEGDRAYRDLLLTQARYKAYIAATSDSDINRALAYFSTHPADREKLTRSYIYKGAVMDEIGHPDSAMFYYKTAEATAAPDDYFNLGYSNLRIAQLYQYYYTNDSAVVVRMQIAANYFVAIKDTSYLITAIGTQGAYPKIIGEDSARLYLKRAIQLSKKIHSSKGLQYQSKLAGRYFYDGDYHRAKDLAMDIIRHGSEKANENQYYYFAARAFIHLNRIDSARWVMSVTPPPINAVDSMNLYQLMADLSRATQQLDDYVQYNEAAKEIDYRIMDASRNSKLVVAELDWNADQQQKKVRSEADNHWAAIVVAILLGMVPLAVIAYRIYYRRIREFGRRVDSISRELEEMIAENGRERKILETLQQNYGYKNTENQQQSADKDETGLGQDQTSISSQVSAIIRYRNAALNELYQLIRIKSVASDGAKRITPLFSVFKEILESNGILSRPLPKSFWDNLKLSVDGEFRGITSFLEQHYPDLSVRDLQLFMLLCAGFPNQIIKLCMNYTHDVTVSKNKKKLIKEKIGLDMKFDEFIESYLQGKLPI